MIPYEKHGHKNLLKSYHLTVRILFEGLCLFMFSFYNPVQVPLSSQLTSSHCSWTGLDLKHLTRLSPITALLESAEGGERPQKTVHNQMPQKLCRQAGIQMQGVVKEIFIYVRAL